MMTDAHSSQPAADEAAAFYELVHAAQDGDPRAMSQLINECRPYLLAIANGEIDDDIAAKVGASDIVQNSILSAQRCIGDFRGQDRRAWLAWLRGILIKDLQEAHRHYRTAKREVSREQPIPDRSRTGADLQLFDQQDSPSTAAAQREQEDRLRRVMALLSDDERLVIELRTWQRLQFAQIGEQMGGRSGDAVRKLWARAIVRLQKLMGEQEAPSTPPTFENDSADQDG